MAPSKEKVPCPLCGKEYGLSGIGRHKKSCQEKQDIAAREKQFHAEFVPEPQKSRFYMLQMGNYIINVGLGSLPAPRFSAPWERGTHAGPSLVDSTSGHAC